MIDLSIRALGVPVRFELSGDITEDEHAGFATAWTGCASAPAEDALVLPLRLRSPAEPGSGAGAKVYRRPEDLADGATVQLTQMLIEARSTDLLMLHACGLAAADGRVIACVAPSGTGKTTLAIAAASRYGYVTDETVGIRRTGEIDVYPKPLSVKRDGGGVKAQVSPSDLGMRAWSPDDPAPVIGRIVVLDRQDDPVDRGVRLTPVGLLDAITELVEQISYLSRLDLPLQRLAGLIEGTGGVLRATYAEASDLVDGIQVVLGEGKAPRLELDDRETRETLEAWRPERRSDADGGVRYLSRPVDDYLIRGAECLVLSSFMVYRLSSLGGAVLALTAKASRTVDDLCEELIDIFGEPAEGESRPLVVGAIADLLDAGLLEEISEG